MSGISFFIIIQVFGYNRCVQLGLRYVFEYESTIPFWGKGEKPALEVDQILTLFIPAPATVFTPLSFPPCR